MFSIIDRYVLRRVAVPLGAAFSIGLLMLLAERLVRLLDTTLGKQNSFSVVFEMLAYLVPHYLGTAIPAALFLGLLFGFSNLSKNQELDAMMAAGFGLHRLARPVVILSLIFAAISVFVFGWAQPYARYAYRSVVYEVQNVEAFFLAEEGVFMQAGARTFILDQLNRTNNTFQKVFVFEEKEDSETETLTARTGTLVSVTDDPRPVLRLRDGVRLVEKPLQNGTQTSYSTSAGVFDRFDTPLGKSSRNLFRNRGADERELTLPELLQGHIGGSPAIPDRAVQSEFHHRLVSMFILPILPFLALPFATGRARNFRGYRIGIALVLIVAFHEIVEQGAVATKSNGLSPWLTLWLPVACLTVFSFWRFYRAAFYIQGSSGENWLGAINDSVASIWSKIRPANKGST